MLVDHASVARMESMPVSKFKASCLAVVQRVKRTGRPVLITRFGEPIAEVVPPSRRVGRGAWLGCMAGTVEILGDEVGPALDARRWSALRK
jgi:prevent-host-death family protein